MPRNALMAFCTFYQGYQYGSFSDMDRRVEKNGYNYQYKSNTVLTNQH